MTSASRKNCSATKQFTENRLGPVSTGPTKDGRFDNQLRAPGHVDQSTKEEFSMDKQSDDRDSAITGYIRARAGGRGTAGRGSVVPDWRGPGCVCTVVCGGFGGVGGGERR